MSETKGTGDGNECSHKEHDDNEKGESKGIKISSSLIKLIFPTLVTLVVTFLGYYLNSNYVPRKEIEEKYIKKYEYDNIKLEISDLKTKIVFRDVYETKMANITQSLERIERSLEANNRDFREILRSLPRNGSNP